MYTVVIPKVVTAATKLVGKGSGQPLLEQQVKISHPDLFCEIAAKVLLSEGTEPYPPGVYEVDPASLQAGQYGRPEFKLKIGRRIEAKKAA